MRTIHVVGFHEFPIRKEYEFLVQCTFIINLCEMFKSRGHTVIYYGDEDAEVNADAIIPVVKTSDYAQLKVVSNNFSDPRYFMADLNCSKCIKAKVCTTFCDNLESIFNMNYNQGDVIFTFSISLVNDININSTDNVIEINPFQRGGSSCLIEHLVFPSVFWYELANSEHDRDDIVSKISNYKTSKVINPWVDTSKFRLIDNVNRSDNTYLYMCRIVEHKGFPRVIGLAARFPGKRFIIAGNAIDYNSDSNILTYLDIDCKSCTIELDNFPNVEYRGIVTGEQKVALLNEVTALLQLSTFTEPFCINVIEAGCCGTPTYAVNNGCFPEITKVGETRYGSLINNGAELEMLINNGYRWDNQAISDHFKDKYNSDRAYFEYMEYIKELAKN